MDKAKILYVSQEIMPYLPETEVARVSRYLPEGVLQKGKEIRTFMPRFGKINERRNQLHEVIRLSGMNIVIDDTDHPLIIKVASIQAARMQIYFIDNDEFFERKAIVSDENGEFDDNDERAIFFARGVLETTKKLRWPPDIIHIHGWFSAFIPVYVRYMMNEDPHFVNSKIVMSIYDDEFTSKWSDGIANKLQVDGCDMEKMSQITVNDYVSLMKMAIDLSDGIIQGSQNINPELLEYVKASGKPFLEYHSEDTLADACNEFYDQIIG